MYTIGHMYVAHAGMSLLSTWLRYEATVKHKRSSASSARLPAPQRRVEGSYISS